MRCGGDDNRKCNRNGAANDNCNCNGAAVVGLALYFPPFAKCAKDGAPGHFVFRGERVRAKATVTIEWECVWSKDWQL